MRAKVLDSTVYGLAVATVIFGLVVWLLLAKAHRNILNSELLTTLEKFDDVHSAKTLVTKGADVNVRDSLDRTALMLSAVKGDADFARSLLANGAEVNARARNGSTALIWACENAHALVARALLSSGAIIEDGDSHGRTPLIAAAIGGNDLIVKNLLDKGAHVGAKDEGGKTALKWAVELRHSGVVQLLKRAGAKE